MGPLISAEVGDKIEVTLRNEATFDVSMYMQCVVLEKSEDGTRVKNRKRVLLILFNKNELTSMVSRSNEVSNPASILRKSISGRHRPVSYPDGPMTVRYRFTLNADWENIFVS